MHVPTGRRTQTVAGYFSDLDKAAEAAAILDKRKAAGIYFPLNEINPALFARSPNQLTEDLKPLTSDNDIIRRRWLPLDFDAQRPAGVSATDDEHCAAEDTARAAPRGFRHLAGPRRSLLIPPTAPIYSTASIYHAMTRDLSRMF